MGPEIDIPCSKCNGTGRASADDPARYWAKVREMNQQTAARMIREAARDCRSNLEDFAANMKDMYIEDARDLRQVAKFCRAGNLDDAIEYARSMDTAAREWIPQLAWDFMIERSR